jgi:glutamate 5-kinase
MSAAIETAALPDLGHLPEPLTAARLVVIKIGSALLVEEPSGQIRRGWLDALADDVAALRRAGKGVILVSSGSIAVGRRHLGLAPGPLKLEEKQASAATGQIRLAHAYQEALARHGVTVAQVLLTPKDTEERRRHLNARATLAMLLKLGACPVINENDTVATAEIRYGDNDRLAARVAAMAGAEALILLSDIDGLYTADPRKDPTARHIPVVDAVTAEIEAMGGDAPVGYSSGGMKTKLEAAKIALAGGCAMAIAKGVIDHPVAALGHGALSTWFLPREKPQTARKRWIGGSLAPHGTVVADAGAARALARGSSLLPAGIRAVEGAFQRGDLILITGPDGRVLARGLAAYGADDARLIAGRRSEEIAAILGYRGRDEMIHRDDLALEPGVGDTASGTA